MNNIEHFTIRPPFCPILIVRTLILTLFFFLLVSNRKIIIKFLGNKSNENVVLTVVYGLFVYIYGLIF